MSPADLSFDLQSLRDHYAAGRLTPVEVVEEVYLRIAANRENPVWITVAPREKVLERARALGRDPRAREWMPLWGVPCAVKDNIDVAGLPTTAACPAFSHVPTVSATAVARLEAAGAIVIGKANLDQFATGLVGTRSPYGAVRNAFHRAYVSGGSSSGSAVAVAAGMVSFSLGTDTAGSGRVPAAFNDLVGLKPTKGLVSTSGVLPACRTLDCVAVFATSVTDAETVFDVLNAFDPADPYARSDRGLPRGIGATFRFGVPEGTHLEFFGDHEYAALFAESVERLQAAGGTPVSIDFTPLAETALLLYQGPWVAERYAAIREFMERSPEALHPVTRQITESARNHSAVDTFEAQYRLAQLQRRAAELWKQVDVLLVPSAPTIHTVAAVEADPVRLNSQLGTYTNFVNLLDMAALAVPSGFRRDGLPFGVTLIGPALADAKLAEIGRRLETLRMGLPLPAPAAGKPRTGHIHVAVVGAHLSGQPLNGQLVERGAKLVRTRRTAPDYRLYALANTQPPKPGLARVPEGGAAIEVEVWEMPTEHFGSFVGLIPGPLGIGTLALDDGSEVKGFICEPHALPSAADITHHGGWRTYLASLPKKPPAS